VHLKFKINLIYFDLKKNHVPKNDVCFSKRPAQIGGGHFGWCKFALVNCGVPQKSRGDQRLKQFYWPYNMYLYLNGVNWMLF
jgi:hypothetical protein